MRSRRRRNNRGLRRRRGRRRTEEEEEDEDDDDDRGAGQRRRRTREKEEEVEEEEENERGGGGSLRTLRKNRVQPLLLDCVSGDLPDWKNLPARELSKHGNVGRFFIPLGSTISTIGWWQIMPRFGHERKRETTACGYQLLSEPFFDLMGF